MTDIDVATARPGERVVIANLMQFYIHDFSELVVGDARNDLGEDGRFADYPLDPWWRDADHIPLLIRAAGRPIGFALLNATSHSGRAVDRNMVEFFIVRKHRRSGAGTAAAHAVFARYPGLWETAVVRRNTAALAFWRKAAASHPRVSAIEEADHVTPEWNGPILRFRIGEG